MRRPVESEERILGVDILPSGVLCIAIGIDTLAYAFEQSEENNPVSKLSPHERRPRYRVIDRKKFAKAVKVALCEEAENGSTPVTRLLDEVAWKAVESGADGVGEAE